MTRFVNRMSQLEASLWCPQRGLIGVSWFVDVELDGEVGEDGMLFDCGLIRPWIKSRLDAGIDHTLLVPSHAPGVTIGECSEGLSVRTLLPYPMEVRAPRQAFTLLPWAEITPVRLASFLSRELMKRPPPRISDLRLRLREETIDGAFYTYSHGLKRHAGNCQRITHGHRSRLHIWQRGERCPALEARWAAWLNDRYLIDQADLAPQAEQECRQSLTSRYRSEQGRFHLRLPVERCIVMDAPTSVEHIAAWLARRITSETGSATRVQAFEGIDKGAIAEARP